MRQAPQPSIQQRVPLGVAVQRSALEQRHDRGGQTQGRVLKRRPGGDRGERRRDRREQVALGRARNLPDHALGLDLVCQQATRRCAKAGDIGFAGQPGGVRIDVSHRQAK